MQIPDIKSQDLLIDKLSLASPFYFWPNNGNLGDLLIAISCRQFFKKHDLPYQEYTGRNMPDSYNIVYGGGGRFVPYWGDLNDHIKQLTDKRVQRCIIFPHSIYGVDYFVKALDERHTVFCRDRQTLDYCSSLNSKSTFLPGDDMGITLDVKALDYSTKRVSPLPSGQQEGFHNATIWNGGFAKKLMLGVYHSTVSCNINSRKKKIAFLLRRDREKSSSYASPFSFDLSSTWNGTCQQLATDHLFVGAMIEALRLPDIVVTDRLHVGIAAIHANKEVYLLDNNYGKISGVYHQSLKSYPLVHLCENNQLPEQLAFAFHKLSSFTNRQKYHLTKLIGKTLSFRAKTTKKNYASE